MGTGRVNFTTTEGVRYVLDKYLTSSDREELRRLNNPYTQGEFAEKLVKRIEDRSGGGSWIPSNYKDELAENAAAIIGTASRDTKTKSGKDVRVYETRHGGEVYEDSRGRLRDYSTGRYVKQRSFEE